jgi:hypothetical protein
MFVLKRLQFYAHHRHQNAVHVQRAHFLKSGYSVFDQTKNTEEILITIGRWLENTPISPTFSSHDRIMGFAALNDLYHPVPSRDSVQNALEQLEGIFKTVDCDSKPPDQVLKVLIGLMAQTENER